MPGPKGTYESVFGEEQVFDSPELTVAPKPVQTIPSFDPNIGRNTEYKRMYDIYKKDLGLFGRKKAKAYFDEQFEQEWNNSEQDRRSKFLEGLGYTFDGTQWNQPEIKEQPIQKNPAQQAASGFWDAVNEYDKNAAQDLYIPTNQLRTNGLDFNNVKQVQEWLTANGFDTKGIDGMYGANTKKAIDTLLRTDQEGKYIHALTDAERDMFRNFQKTATFYNQKPFISNEDLNAMKTSINNLAKSIATTKYQQGGQLSQEQQELQYALIGYVVATKKQPKDENEINQLAQQLIQLKQQDPQKYNQLVQLGQQAQAQKAEKGAKLNYIKSLKGQCPDGEELVYFKKGGMIDCGCQKKEKGGEVKQSKKANAIEEFKKGRKSKKC